MPDVALSLAQPGAEHAQATPRIAHVVRRKAGAVIGDLDPDLRGLPADRAPGIDGGRAGLERVADQIRQDPPGDLVVSSGQPDLSGLAVEYAAHPAWAAQGAQHRAPQLADRAARGILRTAANQLAFELVHDHQRVPGQAADLLQVGLGFLDVLVQEHERVLHRAVRVAPDVPAPQVLRVPQRGYGRLEHDVECGPQWVIDQRRNGEQDSHNQRYLGINGVPRPQDERDEAGEDRRDGVSEDAKRVAWR